MRLRSAAARLVLIGGLALAAVAALPQQAGAISITVGQQGIPSGAYLGSGTFNGSFDINPLLPPNLFQQPYDVVSANITFNFHDDFDSWQVTSQFWYSQSFWNGDGYNKYNHYNVYYYNASESAFVQAGTNSGSVNSSYFSNSGGTNTVYTGSNTYSCGWTCSHTDYFYNVNHIWYQGYTGPFSLSQALSLGSIADLATDGLLNFSIAAGGDFFFDGATLTAVVEPSQIPEPAMLGMVGLGLIGLAAHSRRRRRPRS